MVYSTASSPEFLTDERCYIREIFNMASDKNGSIAQARVSPGTSTANHQLTSTTEWYYILAGNGRVFLNNELHGEVRTGDVVHIPPDTPQYIENIGEGDLIFLCFCSPAFDQANYRPC